MKKLLLIPLIALCSFTPNNQIDSFKILGNLAGGSWQMKTKKGILGERWKQVSENDMRSQGFKISGTDTTMLETVSLIQKGGNIYYISTVKDENEGKSVPFKLTKSTNNQFVFSNPEHDFPQQIGYEIVAKDSLHAWIDGQYNGKYARQDFYYKRVNE